MSLHGYLRAIELVKVDEPFYALIMAAMLRADDDNLALLRASWPDVWDELQARYGAPGGALADEAERP